MNLLHKPIGRNDEEIYQDVINGILEIDSDGCIWKVKAWRGQGKRWGRESYLVDCERRRAENVKADNPYLQVFIQHRNGRTITALAHRIVWRHFNGIIPPGLTINHKNGIKKDNHITNLELMTYSENRMHALDVLGHRKTMNYGISRRFGNANPASKLDAEKVRLIRSSSKTMYALAKEFGVTAGAIACVIRYKTWKHVDAH